MAGRFEFALAHVESSQWHAFERLARVFMADDYREFRTLAAASGDGGRDGMLFYADDEEAVAIQISLAQGWEEKVRKTVARLGNHHPQVREIVYVTNREIGPAADDRRRTLRQKGMTLDVRDRHWFVDRENKSAATRMATDEFCRLVVDPLLPQRDVFDRGRELLNGQESRAALLYLALQASDDSNDRHLTKLCFDSLVRTALRLTDNENRMSRDQVHAWVLSLLPTHDSSEVTMYADRALSRLDKRYIRHWRSDDEFCITYQERERLAQRVAELAIADEVFEDEIREHADFVLRGMGVEHTADDLSDIVDRSRRVLEQFLFERGEAFVESVSSGQSMLFTQEEILELSTRDLHKHPDQTSLRHNIPRAVSEIVERATLNATEASTIFLHAIGDAYTLFAFLRETPNVHAAVSKLFSQGQFWLDTSAVLPLMAEELLEVSERRNSVLVRAINNAGANVYVTNGVVDELLHHIEHSLKAWRSPTNWRARTPFLYSTFLWSGRSNPDYPEWLRTFRGSRRPNADLADYLRDVHGIKIRDLHEAAERAPEQLRWHTQEYWREVHGRRRPGVTIDPEVVQQLTSRDVENFLGVHQMRGGEEIGNPFGYRHWWVCLTRSAVRASESIRVRCGLSALDSPVLSYDFLTHYLAVGPARKQLDKGLEQRLPMMLDTSLLDAPPTVLLEEAEAVRKSMSGQDDRLIRREIRDRLEAEKLSQKRVGRAGMDAIVDDLRTALELQRTV